VPVKCLWIFIYSHAHVSIVPLFLGSQQVGETV